MRTILYVILMISLCGITAGKTIIVDNTKDDTKQGSLRWAITEANKDTDTETKIHFSFLTTDSKGKKISTVIYINSALPTITKKMTIDGLANGMGTGNTNTSMIGVNNTNLHIIVESSNKRTYDGFKIAATASGSKIQGLVINKFNYGIHLDATNSVTIKDNAIGSKDRGNNHGIYSSKSSNLNINNNIVNYNFNNGIWFHESNNSTCWNNYLGITNTGAMAGNGWHGMYCTYSYSISIGQNDNGENYGNIISGNSMDGIMMAYCDDFTIRANYIGLSIGGMVTARNNNDGIRVEAPYRWTNIQGSRLRIHDNIISGNSHSGISILENEKFPTDCTITKNYIGLAANGYSALGNGHDGIFLNNVLGVIIGGSSDTKNLISGNSGNGITVLGFSANINAYPNSANIIAYNYIGTNKDGSNYISNQVNGIRGESLTGLTIDNNLISGNSKHGISILEHQGIPSSSFITSNYIGVTYDGYSKLPNKECGVYLDKTSDITIGGSADKKNLISGNGKCGVLIEDSPANNKSNLISYNYIGTNEGSDAVIPNQSSGIRIFGNKSGTIYSSIIKNNLVSGNKENGIHIKACRTTQGEQIYDNIVGLDASAKKELKNIENGVLLSGVHNATIKNNILSGNGFAGIELTSVDDTEEHDDKDQSRYNTVIENYIGLNGDGKPLQNGEFAILLDNGANFNNNRVPISSEPDANDYSGRAEARGN